MSDKPESKRCKRCGACEECGALPQPQIVPMPCPVYPSYPVYPNRWYPQYPQRPYITYGGTSQPNSSSPQTSGGTYVNNTGVYQ